MSWAPPENTVDTSGIESAIMAYIAENQAEAIAYANGGTELKPFVFLENILANPNKPGLPSLEVTGEQEQTTILEQLLRLEYKIEFESLVTATSADAVKGLAKIYAESLKLLLGGVSLKTLVKDLADSIPDEQFSPSARYGSILSNDNETAFFMKFTVAANYQILTQFINQ